MSLPQVHLLNPVLEVLVCPFLCWTFFIYATLFTILAFIFTLVITVMVVREGYLNFKTVFTMMYHLPFGLDVAIITGTTLLVPMYLVTVLVGFFSELQIDN